MKCLGKLQVKRKNIQSKEIPKSEKNQTASTDCLRVRDAFYCKKALYTTQMASVSLHQAMIRKNST